VRRGANVHLWAVRGTRGRIRVVVINKDLRDRGRVRIRVRGARGRGRLTRLTAPGVSALTGVKLAGQSVPWGSSDGRLRGRRVVRKVRRRHRTYAFSMGAASAAVLEVRVPGLR
jgi:hypothetical protein